MIDDMKWAYPPSNSIGWIDTRLNKETIEYLWKIVKKGEKDGNNAQGGLVGNINKSFYIEDENQWFYRNVLMPSIDFYMNHDKTPFDNSFNKFKGDYIIKDKNNKVIEFKSIGLDLNSFWANYQKKHEFNPLHNHNGVFSFVIWLKIPYETEDQCKLPFLDGIDESNKFPGQFEFSMLDWEGNIRQIPYRLGKEDEGRMLFFPSNLHHVVHPFYDNDENRVSISGNLNLSITCNVG